VTLTLGSRWRCSLCDCENQFTGEQLARYSNQALLSQLSELDQGLVELDVPVDEDSEVGKDIHTRPVYIAAVDLSGEQFEKTYSWGENMLS
jgi:hypothetical protein